MDWLRMLSVLLILLFFEEGVMAGSRQKIRIHIPQKVKHIHHHKKIYITKYPASDIGTLQQHGITDGQYAPGFTSTSESVPNVALSESRVGSLAPNLLPMYRARGHYGPPPVYTKAKRATKTRRGKRTKVIKLSPVRRKRVSRKKVNKKHRDSKKNNADKETNLNSQRESTYRDYYQYDTPYEMSETYPTRYKYKKPKRVQKYVDKDGEHIHTYSEEHIHQIIYDDPPYNKQEEDDNDYKPNSNYYTKDDEPDTMMPLSLALQNAYQAGNPSASNINSVVLASAQPLTSPTPSTNSYNYQTPSSANNHYMNSKKPVIVETFPPFHPLGYKKHHYSYNPVMDGAGSMGTPSFMEYMDYDPNEATHDHTVHDHGELSSADYSTVNNYEGGSPKYTSNPYLTGYYKNENKKPHTPSWLSNTNGYKSKWKNYLDNSSENTKEISITDSSHANPFTDYSNKHVTSVSYGVLPAKESATKIPDLYYDHESSSEHYLTTTRQPSVKNHRFRQRQKPTTKLYPSSISSEEDDQENVYKFKTKVNYYTTETPTTTKSIPIEFKGVFDQKFYTDKLKGSYNGHTSVEGTTATFSNENSYGGTNDQYRDTYSQSSYRPVLKNSYGHSTPETLEYELGFLSKNKHRYGESPTPSYSKKPTKNKGKAQSMSSQTISFGGQDHTTVVNHFGDRSSSTLLESREGRDDDSSPSALTYDNIILTNEFNAQSSNLNTNIPEIDMTNFNNVEKPKLSDLVFTEKSFSLETTTLPGTSATELSSILSPNKATLRPVRKFRRTNSIFKPKSNSRTKTSRRKQYKSDDNIEETTQFSYTTYSPGRGLKYGDRVLK